MSNESSAFDKAFAAMKIIELLSIGGATAPQSQVEIEPRDGRPSISQEASKQSEDLLEIVKVPSFDKQIESMYEKSKEEANDKQEKDSEINELAANESSISGSPPEPPNETVETETETEVSNETESTSEETQPETEISAETESISEITSQSEVSIEDESNNVETQSENGFISEIESPSELAAEYGISLESESANGESTYGSEGSECGEGGRC